jgi:hypothetical protein
MQPKSLARLLAAAAIVEYVYDEATAQRIPRSAGDKRFTARRIWVN